MNLGVDPRHADQMVRGVVGLPNGTGKDVRVAVFAVFAVFSMLGMFVLRGVFYLCPLRAGQFVVSVFDLVEASHRDRDDGEDCTENEIGTHEGFTLGHRVGRVQSLAISAT